LHITECVKELVVIKKVNAIKKLNTHTQIYEAEFLYSIKLHI